VARCEQGYLCDVCGGDVEEMTDSDLYLRYVLGEVLPQELNLSRERHLRCNPTLAQFIVDERFPPVRVAGGFAKENLDPAFVAEEEERVTRGWRRLQTLPGLELPLTAYPLPEVLDAQLQAALARDPNLDTTEYAQRMRGYLEGMSRSR
jgi:hypothetical protein